MQQANKTQYSVLAIGAVLGGVLSWGLLSGDQQGRVNLLYLLLIFVALPIFSLAISLFSLIGGRGVNFIRSISKVPLWPQSKQRLFLKLHSLGRDKLWFLWQSQVAALAFSIASLLTFFLLLLITDINFVWRSTLLSAEHLQPTLKLIATPWWFWHDAQPSLELLQHTQNSRIAIQVGEKGIYAQWWPFILCTQLVYSLLPRGLMLLLAKRQYQRNMHNDIETHLQRQIKHSAKQTVEPVAQIKRIRQIPRTLSIINWCGVDVSLLQRVDEITANQQQMFIAGAKANAEQQRLAQQQSGDLLVLVKAWEPPLGELMDFLHNLDCKNGYVMPLDWQQDTLVPCQLKHLQEWQRFADQAGWQLFVPDAYVGSEVVKDEG